MAQNNYYSLGRNSHQIIRDGSFSTKKQFIQNQLFNLNIVQHNILIQGLLRKLHATYIHEKIPDFYSYFFMGQLTLCNQDRIIDSINREIQQLKNKHSHYHIMMRNIGARQTCLKSIASCIQGLFQQTKPPLFDKLAEQIKHLRQLTVWVVDNIKKWKQSLLFLSQSVFQDEHIAFFYQNQDYVLRILRDNDFISKSFLSEKVKFSYKQDPFLMRPYTQDQSNNQFSKIFKFSSEEQQKYIESLQFLADERADYLKRKITAKNDRIKEIERIYQVNHFTQKILVTKANPLSLRKAKDSINEAPIDFIQQKSAQQSKRSIRSSSLTRIRENRNKQLQIKDQKIKKIKEMDFSSNPIINIKKFNSEKTNEQNPIPINRSISLGILKKQWKKLEKSKKQKEIQSDFQILLRKKQLQILDGDNLKRRPISTIRLKDRLSEGKLIDNKEGAQELRKILQQIQSSSPQQQKIFIRKDPSTLGKSLIHQNEQTMVKLRQSILKQISDHTTAKQKDQERKIQQNNYLDKVIKMKLEQEQLKDIQKQKSKWIQGKDALALDINKPQLFGIKEASPQKFKKLVELQEQLKRQMQLKFLRQVHQQLSHREAMNKHSISKNKQKEQRQKQLQVVLQKKSQEQRFQEIEKQQRNKMIRMQFADEEKRRNQIEKEMQGVIERQQIKLIQFSHEQKLKLQSQLRQNMKEKLLSTLKKQKSIVASQNQALSKQKQLQEQHRAQVRKKMEQQYQIQKNLQRHRERQQKNRKLRLVAQKMDYLGQQVQKSKMIKQQQSKKKENVADLKQSLSQIPKMTTKRQEENKQKLRQEFQLELFAFNRPQYIKNQQEDFIVNDFKKKLDNDYNLNKEISPQKQASITEVQQESYKKKESSLKAQILQLSEQADKFVRFSQEQKEVGLKKPQEEINQDQLRRMGINMSPEQYTIYKKKKGVLDIKRINPPKMQQAQIKKVKLILDDFEKMSNLDSQRQQQQKIDQQVPLILSFIQKQNSPKKNTIKQEEPFLKKSNKQLNIQQMDSSDLSKIMKLSVHSKMGSVHKKRFATSDNENIEEQQSEQQSRIFKKKKQNKKHLQKKSKVKQEKYQEKQEKQEKQIIKNNRKIQTTNFKLIDSDDLDNYLTNHFKKLSKTIRKVNLLKKEELLKSLDDYKNLIIVQVSREQQIEGIVLIVENENKQNIRSLNILHFGAYLIENTVSSLVKARNLLFAKDPCSEITFSMYYNKQDEEQYAFIQQFEKQFDPYGAIFQKQISNQQTQRKHIFRRMIGEEGTLLQKNKGIGQLKIHQNIISYNNQHSLGVNLKLQKSQNLIGSWTMLSIFLSSHGKQQQIVQYLTSDVEQQSKNIKHISKMVMKLKNNRFPDIQYETNPTPFQMNLRLIQINEQLIKCDPSVQQNNIPITLMKSNIILNYILPFTSATAQFHYKGSKKIGKYLRFKSSKGSKVIKLKSSLYSSTITVLPCKPSNYKILLTDSLEYDNISSKISIDLYVKLFLANISQHVQNTDEYIWIPQASSQRLSSVDYCQQFGFKHQMRSKMEFYFTEYIQNCINYKPTHRDLFITPPYIMAVINLDIEKLSQGSPIYIERVDINDMIGVTNVSLPQQESDF